MKLALIIGFSTLYIDAIIHAFLKEYKKIPIIPILYFSCIIGFICGSLLSPDSINIETTPNYLSPQIVTNIDQLTYVVHPITSFLIGLLQFSFVIYYLYASLVIFRNARNKKIAKGLFVNNIIFIIPLILFNFYLVSQINIFREFYSLILFINFIGICYMLIKRFELFLVLTNQIYYINIYHKSGVLLYSYKLEKIENEMESAIWGNILIGLNHILSEFIDTKDQIDILQTKKSDIIVDYNNDLGFAVLVITNQKNDILQKMMESFMTEFVGRYSNELNEIQDLNKMINVSEFNDTKEIIETNFQIYL
jgi:hypothetical protein